MLRVYPMLRDISGADKPIVRRPGEGQFSVGLAGTLTLGRVGKGTGADPSLRHLALRPEWLGRRKASEIPDTLLSLAMQDSQHVSWRCGTSRQNEFRIAVGPSLVAPSWQEHGMVFLPPASSVDLAVWCLTARSWRQAMTIRIENSVPTSRESTAGTASFEDTQPVGGLVRAWVEGLKEVMRSVLWQTIELRDSPDLLAEVRAATGKKDTSTKWNSIERSLADFVRSHPDDETGQPWLHHVIDLPALRDHIDKGHDISAPAEEMRSLANYIAQFPDYKQWEW